MGPCPPPSTASSTPLSDSTANLEAIANKIRASLTLKHEAREAAYPLTRQVVRSSANAIRAVHRHQFEDARQLLDEARGLLARIDAAIAEHADLQNAGYVDTAQKEYAEAAVTFALASDKPVPTPEELGVREAPYLNGLAEAASEMRRHLLDALRHDQVARCEEILGAMDDIYSVLVSMDFPDALTSNLRRTTDQLRGVLERTRGDLTMAIGQARLVRKARRRRVPPP